MPIWRREPDRIEKETRALADRGVEHACAVLGEDGSRYEWHMAHGDLAVVEQWLRGVNEGDRARVLGLTAEDVEIVGPRGVGRGRELLGEWLARAGFTSEARRWFCGEDGRVVVEQDARWALPDGKVGEARVASAFVVQEGRVARFERFETLAAALTMVGLEERDEANARL